MKKELLTSFVTWKKFCSSINFLTLFCQPVKEKNNLPLLLQKVMQVVYNKEQTGTKLDHGKSFTQLTVSELKQITRPKLAMTVSLNWSWFVRPISVDLPVGSVYFRAIRLLDAGRLIPGSWICELHLEYSFTHITEPRK